MTAIVIVALAAWLGMLGFVICLGMAAARGDRLAPFASMRYPRHFR